MDKETKFQFAIIHLDEIFTEQYNEKRLRLSKEQTYACFCEFVDQYFSALIQSKRIIPIINPNVPSSYKKHNWYKNPKLFKLDNFGF